jgi:hypothetical protein
MLTPTDNSPRLQEANMARSQQRANPSQRKISETFLEFAEPLWVPLGPAASDQELEQVLLLAWTVWNAIVFGAAAPNQPCQQELRELRNLVDQDSGARMVVEHLIARKQTLFADDQRLIGRYRLNRRQGELHLWAEARLPHRPR